MSGGFFDYGQYSIEQMYEKLLYVVRDAEEAASERNELFWKYNFTYETLAEFKIALELLKATSTYMQRIDWLISGDDSEGTFHERLAEDMQALNNDEDFKQAIK